MQHPSRQFPDHEKMNYLRRPAQVPPCFLDRADYSVSFRRSALKRKRLPKRFALTRPQQLLVREKMNYLRRPEPVAPCFPDRPERSTSFRFSALRQKSPAERLELATLPRWRRCYLRRVAHSCRQM